jgi:hypothetical protein
MIKFLMPVLLLLLSAELLARNVVVNGQAVYGQTLAQLDQLSGEPVPDGRYWLNLYTGEWGYEGGPSEGFIGQRPSPPAAGGNKRWFEDEVGDFCAHNGGCNW